MNRNEQSKIKNSSHTLVDHKTQKNIVYMDDNTFKKIKKDVLHENLDVLKRLSDK